MIVQDSLLGRTANMFRDFCTLSRLQAAQHLGDGLVEPMCAAPAGCSHCSSMRYARAAGGCTLLLVQICLGHEWRRKALCDCCSAFPLRWQSLLWRYAFLVALSRTGKHV